MSDIDSNIQRGLKGFMWVGKDKYVKLIFQHKFSQQSPYRNLIKITMSLFICVLYGTKIVLRKDKEDIDCMCSRVFITGR